MPYGVEVVQVAPATLPIEFENSAVRIVQVRPSIEGRPAPGYEVVSVTSDPSTVEVVGPESSLRGLDEAMTEPVSVANETRPVREVVTIGVADPSGAAANAADRDGHGADRARGFDANAAWRARDRDGTRPVASRPLEHARP